MNKAELVELVAMESGESEAATRRVIDAMAGVISVVLANCGEVKLVGFGKFHLKTRAARMGRDPRNGQPIQFKAKRVAAFRPGKTLAGSVR